MNRLQKIKENHYKLDVRGLACPYPQVLALRELSNLTSGDVLEIILDNPPSVREVPPVLVKRGYSVETSRQDNSTWRLIVKS